MKLLGMAIATYVALTVSGCSDRGAPPVDQAGQNAAAASNAASAAAPTARADLRDAQGQSKGSATATQDGTGIQVRLDATGMAPGSYAAHIHMVGACDAPKFESAGAHWNPTSKQHGRDNPAGMHKGDLDNLTVGADGRGSIAYTVQEASLSGGAAALLDADGAAVLIHAKPDDYRSDPSGNAGDRIACGVLR